MCRRLLVSLLTSGLALRFDPDDDSKCVYPYDDDELYPKGGSKGTGLAVALWIGLALGAPTEYAGVLYGLTPVVSSATLGSTPPRP